jgi:hypothetical protein
MLARKRLKCRPQQMVSTVESWEQRNQVEIEYIAGSGRSGSTLVGSVLGLADDHVFVGELRLLWQEGLLQNTPCGCGKEFLACPFWSKVLQEAFGGFEEARKIAPKELLGPIDRLPNKLKQLDEVLTFPAPGRETPDQLRTLSKLYVAIAKVSGARVLVDSSKSLRYAAMLNSTPGLKLRMTNLIRNPGGILMSRSKRPKQRDGSEQTWKHETRRMKLVKTLSKWAVRNALAARIIRRRGGIRLIYEDFTRDQSWYLTTVLGPYSASRVLTQLRDGVNEGTVQHQIGGNWVREMKIRPDEKWRTELPFLPRIIAGVLSFPMMQVYRSKLYVPR